MKNFHGKILFEFFETKMKTIVRNGKKYFLIPAEVLRIGGEDLEDFIDCAICKSRSKSECEKFEEINFDPPISASKLGDKIKKYCDKNGQ